MRKPFMLAGGVGGAVMVAVFGLQAGRHPTFGTLALIVSVLYVALAFAYASWMAAFTETVEARNPALTGTGLAVWGWLLRLVVTASFLLIPLVVNTVTTLVEAPEYLAEYQRARQAHLPVSPELADKLAAIQRAAADARDQAEHDRAVAAELAKLT